MTRVELTALYPERPGEEAGKWTDRVLSHAKEYGTNRQCSIGWHGECSDRSGESCQCLCHDEATRWFTVEGHPDSGGHIIHKVEQGKHHWPPADDEPAGTWAHWIMGTSAEDAKNRAIAKQDAIVAAAEPVKPDPGTVLAEKVAGLTRVAATTWREYNAGIISVDEYNKQREWAEADLTEAWREYVHTLD